MNETLRRTRWLALARTSGAVAHGIARALVSRPEEGAGERLAAAFAGDVAMRAGIREEFWSEAVQRLGAARAEILAAERAGARIVDVEDHEYPALLREIADPPPALFVLGALEAGDARAAAIIGSREATRYGIAVTRTLVPPLVGRGVTIVSGMARGIDAAAHRAALASGGRTIAVLGTGIDRCYPRSSQDLYRAIPQSGAIVSEVAPGTEPRPWVFPPRNRILSGLSRVVVIVEARLRSGTSVTAGHALEQGREVGVVPGDVDLARSAGTNALLADGAFPVRSAEDVLVCGFGEAVTETRGAPARRPVPPGLDPDAARLWPALAREAATLEGLVQATGLAAAAVMAGIGRLERAGLVRSDAWGRYAPCGAAEAVR